MTWIYSIPSLVYIRPFCQCIGSFYTITMSAVENYIDRMSISPLIHHITADRTETVQVILYDGRVIVVRFPPSSFTPHIRSLIVS